MTHRLLVLLALVLAMAGTQAAAADSAPGPIVDYNRDVRPILSNNCYACHGPDEAKREAGLRLDKQEAALAALESGGFAIVPGNSSTSKLIARVATHDDGELMPPKESGKRLLPAEIETLRKWVDQGASWKAHWSYLPVERPPQPAVSNAAWLKSPIDAFVMLRLDEENARSGSKLAPAPEADKRTLIRRLSYDLTGLPPSIADGEAFVADASSGAYESLVDRLLASPHYGERMAQRWLDLARYADTNGYHIDNHRDMWLYRDWVIGAFNRNLPFDRFTVEQIAGDLLPNPTMDQRIASGFHRNVMVNFEGGADPNEYLTKYIVDRVTTTATVWLGSTLACTECHDHKYDPFTQREFYQLFAYFNNVPEQGLDGQKENPKPSMRVPTTQQSAQAEKYRGELAELESRIRAELAKVDAPAPTRLLPVPSEPREYVWIDDALPEGGKPDGAEGANSWRWTTSPQPVLHGRLATERTATGTSQQLFTGAQHPLSIGKADRLVAHVYLDPANPPEELMLQFHDGTWEHRAYWGADKIDWGAAGSAARVAAGPLPPAGRWVRLEVDAAAVGLQPGSTVNGWSCTQFGGHVFWDKLGLITTAPQGPNVYDDQAAWELAERMRPKPKAPAGVRKALDIEPGKRSDEQKQSLHDHFARYFYTGSRATFDPLNSRIDAVNQAQKDLDNSVARTMVMEDMPKPRETFVLVRGDFRTKGDPVTPGVPASIAPLPSGAPGNRLGLAQWLVDARNPLVARVTVNRFWQQYFGVGLVKTSEDFGTQGQLPSHPELLDWLASEFVASGWDIKALQKLIVMSATYRQSSHAAPEAFRRDPENRLLARGPRFRLDAEMIRDTALATSGLLDDRLGGPSVAPYQPPGLWEAVSFGKEFSAQVYEQSHGRDLYRRGLYVYWKRALPYPSMATFDAPNREVCTDCRARTNTPLQALVLLNDPAYVEAARALAQRTLREGGASTAERIAFAFKLCTARAPEPKELEVLTQIYQTQLARFKQDAAAAAKLISIGESARPADIDPAELAAWTAIGNVLLNLDETITKG
jgi:hypothetical protein